MADKFKDFRGVEFPACLRRLGFKDLSWGNDAAARAAVDVGAGKVLVVWCLARSRRARVDQGDGITMRTPRFHGYVCRGRVDRDIHDDKRHERPFLCETEADLSKKVKERLSR